jgi:hypothetical protein
MSINSRSFENDLELILNLSNSFAKLKARERQAAPIGGGSNAQRSLGR